MRINSPLVVANLWLPLACLGVSLPRWGGNHDGSGQKPLTGFGSSTAPHHSKPNAPYSVKEHAGDSEICVAGSKHYSGTVSVSEDKKLFFCELSPTHAASFKVRFNHRAGFFESRRDPRDSPVTVWLNGGPGGSSMYGLFQEIGPCLTNEHNNGTVFNKHSWTRFSNMLFIE